MDVLKIRKAQRLRVGEVLETKDPTVVIDYEAAVNNCNHLAARLSTACQAVIRNEERLEELYSHREYVDIEIAKAESKLETAREQVADLRPRLRAARDERNGIAKNPDQAKAMNRLISLEAQLERLIAANISIFCIRYTSPNTFKDRTFKVEAIDLEEAVKLFRLTMIEITTRHLIGITQTKLHVETAFPRDQYERLFECPIDELRSTMMEAAMKVKQQTRSGLSDKVAADMAAAERYEAELDEDDD